MKMLLDETKPLDTDNVSEIPGYIREDRAVINTISGAVEVVTVENALNVVSTLTVEVATNVQAADNVESAVNVINATNVENVENITANTGDIETATNIEVNNGDITTATNVEVADDITNATTVAVASEVTNATNLTSAGAVENVTNATTVVAAENVEAAATVTNATGTIAAATTVTQATGCTITTAGVVNEFGGVTATAGEINDTCDGVDAKNSHTHQLVDGADDITASAADLNQLDGVTVGGVVAGDIVTINATQTLTAKTLTSPVINTGVSGTAIADEDTMVSDSNTKLATQQSIKTYVDRLSSGLAIRSIFTYKDADEIYVGTGVYHLYGKGMARWNSQLTFVFGSGGSNAASEDLGADEFHYVYLDYSAITAGVDITAAMLLNNTTAPAWSHTKHGWYNGDDRCIFSILTNAGSEILEFFHSGDFVAYADRIADLDETAITTWQNVTLSIPGFASRAQVVFSMEYDTAEATGYWRTDGQSGTEGHNYGFVNDEVYFMRNTANVVTSAAQVIEIMHGIDAELETVYSSTADGIVYFADAVWATVHDAIAGWAAGWAFPGNDNTMTSYFEALVIQIFRSFFYFDLSALHGTVTGITAKIHGTTNAESNVAVQKGTQSDILVDADFDAFTGSEYGHTAGWTTSAYNEIAFNAQGISDVQDLIGVGTFKMVAREYDHDYLDVTSGADDFRNGCFFADSVDINYRPKLEITFTVGSKTQVDTDGWYFPVGM